MINKINPDLPAKVYFNLHKKCFSVQQKGLVVAHVNEIFLQNATFKVSEAGRQKVIATKRKNVHAFVVGNVMPDEVTPYADKLALPWLSVTYNPYKYSSFVLHDGVIPIMRAGVVSLVAANGKGSIKVLI